MSRARGLTLVEVVISSAVLSVIALVLLGAALPLSDASSSQATALDMDRDAGRILGRLREDLRRSGYESNGTPRVRVLKKVLPNDALELYVRLAPDGVASPWRPPGVPWATPISWTTTPSAGRLALVRAEDGLGVTIGAGLQRIEYTLPADALSLGVSLTLVRRAARGGPDVVRVYADQVQMMNRPR